MKPGDKAIEAMADELQHHGVHHGWFPKGLPSDWRKFDPIGRREFLDIVGRLADAAYAAQFQSEDHAGLVERLKNLACELASVNDTVGEKFVEINEAADALEAVLAERAAWKGRQEATAAILKQVETERDALLARLAPVDDEALVEIVANAISKFFNEMPSTLRGGQARVAIAAVRPHIEAAERERCAKIAEEWSASVFGDSFDEKHVTEICNSIAPNIAAAIRSGK